MTGKVIELLKNGSFVIPKILIANYKKMGITDEELVFLICLIDNNEFDPEKIANAMGIEVINVLTLIDSLSKKDILCLESVKHGSSIEEFVNLDQLYSKLSLCFVDGDISVSAEESINIYDNFEKEFGRTLSPMEYQIIGAWVDSGFEENTINLALKEAIFNGITNLRYIDKILFEWKKKGIKTKEDIEKNNKIFKNKKTKEEVFDYDWLNE